MRTTPLIVAIAVFIAIPLSMGAAILLVPICVALWAVAARRAGWTPREGPQVLTTALALDIILAFELASAAAILVHDSLIG